MDMTTIAVPKKLREELKEFGNMGETFADVLERLLNSARKRMLHDFLYSEEGFVSIDEAIAEAKRKWPSSK